MVVTNYAIKFRVAVIVFAIVSAILGTLAYLTLPREGAPDITIPFVTINASYEGTAPEEIENLVTIPIEKKLNDLENVKEIRSQSTEGVALISIEFLPGQDIDAAQQKVKDKIDLARPDLPNDLDEPTVQAFNFSTDFPIIMFQLSGGTDLDRLRRLAEDLQDPIERLPGVREAAVFGAREREIRVEIDLPRLVQYGLPLEEVSRAIARENATVSAGNLEMAGGKFQVRVPGEFVLASEIGRMVVAVRDGKPVYLSDIATVTDTYKDLTSITRINGEPCISLQVKKRSGENTAGLIDQIKRIVADFRLPPEVKITITMDQSKDITSMIRELENNIFAGFVLVVIVVLLFMGVRNSLFVGMAIPLSMLITFVVLQMMGLTLNMIVLFSLVLAVGMLVDNAIVITENIYRNRTLGLSRMEAATRGAAEVAWPVITSTLTTVVAFWPLLTWPSVIGQFMSFLPKTIIVSLLSSLFVGLVVNPALCSLFMKGARQKVCHDRHGELVSDHPFILGYDRFLRGALANRGLVMVLGFLLLVVSLLAYAHFGRGMELFPDTEPRSATITLRYPQGTPIEKTEAALLAIERRIPQYRDVKFFLTDVGSIKEEGSAGETGTHVGSIIVEFVDAADRTGSSMALVEQMRAGIQAPPGAEITVGRSQEGPPPKPPISLEISGESFDELAALAGEIKRAIQGVPGLVDLKDDFEEALPELQFRVDRRRAALLGLDTDAVGAFLRTAIYGGESSKFRAGEDEYDITVRLPFSARDSAELMDRTFIPRAVGEPVPLSSLGETVYTAGRGVIKRINQRRAITLTGDIQGRSIDAVLGDVQAAVSKVTLPGGYGVTYTGQNADMKESGTFLFRALLLAVAAIAVIMVIQFNSAILPGIVMISVILSMIGVLWGLMLARLRFGVVMTGLGVISLAGIVVNNSIVLIDCILQRRKEGMPVDEAVVTAGRLRLRPVLLTAGTTVLGLIPMAVGWSVEIHTWPWRLVAGAESSAWWAPMAVAVIFGLSLATLLTLVQVPVMYSLADGLILAFRRRFSPKD